MSFTSSLFLIGLLPWFILLIFLLRNIKNSKYILIILANSVFYIWSGVGFFIFICMYSLAIWLFSIVVSKNKNIVVFAVIIFISLLPLILCKYIVFVISNINLLFVLDIDTPDFIMPLGISFFTFETISLLTDVFKRKVRKKTSFVDVFTYITFFPTVTSGPILRFSDYHDGISTKVDGADFGIAIERIVIGLSKKVLIADKIAVLADYYFDGLSHGSLLSTAGLWIGSIAYTLQLYYDFSGYSDMAVGIGLMMGFHIPENFNKPYQARSISDFWRRWHISLSQWFRDYVYIPLGGNRCNTFRHVFNMFAVWLVTGLWHGADWSFIVWGLGYFILLIAEKYIPAVKKLSSSRLGVIYTLFFVNLLWVPFRALNLETAEKYIAGMIGIGSSGGLEEIAIEFMPFVLLSILLCCPIDRIYSKFENKRWFSVVKGAIIVTLAFLAFCAVINSSYSPYIYGGF